MLRSPSADVDGYREARLYDKALADSYIRHTTIGDPSLDPVMEEVSSPPPHHLHRFIKAGIDQEEEGLRAAPQALSDFFKNLEDPRGRVGCDELQDARSCSGLEIESLVNDVCAVVGLRPPAVRRPAKRLGGTEGSAGERIDDDRHSCG